MNRIAISLVIAVTMFSMSFSGCLDDGSDFGLTWEEPAEVTIYWFYYNEVEESFEVNIRLWDDDDEVTEWDGDVRIILYNDNLEPVHNKTRKVRTGDFKSDTDTDIYGTLIVDTFLEMKVAKSVLAEDPTIHEFPDWSWDVEVWFSYDGLTLKSSPRNWRPPEIGFVAFAGVGWGEDDLHLELRLEWMDTIIPIRPAGDPYDEPRPTKAKGQLAVVITDSLGFTMYDGRIPVEPKDFEVRGWQEDPGTTRGIDSCIAMVLIPLSDIAGSTDRRREEMNITFAFIYKGQEIDTGRDPFLVIDMPQELILPNQLPVTLMTGPDWCWINEDVEFDMTGSHDPDGGIHDMGILADAPNPSFMIRQRPSETQPKAVIAFFELGYYNLTFKIQDSDLEWNETVHQIEVRYPIKIEAVRTGVVNLTWGYHNNTYVTLKLTNQAPESIYVGNGEPQLIVLDEHGREFEVSGNAQGGYPTTMDGHQVMEVSLYYQYTPEGGTEVIPFVPVTMILWPGQELDLRGLWVGG